ncbi:MAG: tyrosine-type recombinase/integrase [Oscillospiraceae bacterium]
MARKSVERGISYDEERGRYYVLLDFGKDACGTRARTYKTFQTLAQARSARSAFWAERDVSRPVLPQSITLGQWLSYWLEEVIAPSRAETTAYGYRGMIKNHTMPALGEIPLQQLAPQDIQRYYGRLLSEKSLSPNTVRRHHAMLSSALRMAVRQQVLAVSPADRVDPPRVAPHEMLFYGPEALRALYAAAEGTDLELPVHLAGSLGLRREELCGLRWNAVDFARRRVQICAARTVAGKYVVEKETKNSSSIRVLYLTDELYSLLRRKRDQQQRLCSAKGEVFSETGLVVTNPQGIPVGPNNLSLSFCRFLKRHNLPKITLHGLRHTFATLASAQGAPLFDIGKALGHSSPATTGRIYTHLLDQTHEHLLEQVAAAVR